METKNIIEKILNVTNAELDSIDINSLVKDYVSYSDWILRYMPVSSGTEHYRLLVYISSLFENELLFDVGTNRAMSAMALSHNKKNKVKSYDVVQVLGQNPPIQNVEYVIGNCIEDPEILKSPFIMLDTYHDGIFEMQVYNHLKQNNYKGLLLLDDIYLNDPMKQYWNQFSETKYDITSKGHATGTGIVIFE